MALRPYWRSLCLEEWTKTEGKSAFRTQRCHLMISWRSSMMSYDMTHVLRWHWHFIENVKNKRRQNPIMIEIWQNLKFGSSGFLAPLRSWNKIGLYNTVSTTLQSLCCLPQLIMSSSCRNFISEIRWNWHTVINSSEVNFPHSLSVESALSPLFPLFLNRYKQIWMFSALLLVMSNWFKVRHNISWFCGHLRSCVCVWESRVCLGSWGMRMSTWGMFWHLCSSIECDVVKSSLCTEGNKKKRGESR